MSEILEKSDAATRIGKLYRKGRESLVLAGEMLITQKASMAHGEWLPWLKANEKALGFAHRTADRLMKFVASDEFDLWGHNTRGTQGTGENEWYTPAKYIELARSVLGSIDLDPASSEHAQRTVQAAKFFTLETDGLKQDWFGNVWLNPPYAQPYIANFVSKVVQELEADRVRSAIMLTHNYTDTSWFHEAAEIASAICFSRGRVKFLDPAGNDCAPTQGQAFFYFGEEVTKFAATFLEVGFVVVGAAA